MNRFLRLADRALRMPPAEWQGRARQAGFGLRNRWAPWLGSAALPADGHRRALGGALGRVPASTEALAAWWQTRSRRWFLGAQTGLRLEQAQRSGALDGALDRAERVCAGAMPLFSLPAIPWRDPDRWHRDPLTGRVAPLRPYPRVPYLDPGVVGDHKLIWEPSRFAWSHWLGLAYRLRGSPRYRDAFVALCTDWLDRNPYPYGIHYCSALEVGLRAYAWLWALAFFDDVWESDPALLERLLGGIWTACRHVEENLSRYFAPNTHLTGEAFALFACAEAIPEWAESPRWRALGASILAEEAGRQFFKDGTHRELSSGYHLYSTDFYLQACLIARETGSELDTRIPEAARRACVRLADFADADGQLQPFNDCDGGRLLHWGDAALDAGPTLAAAAALWPDLPLQAPTRRGYAILMTPPSTPVSGPTPAPLRRVGAPDSGIQSYRNAAGDLLIFRATPFGYLDAPHSHDAPLSFLLSLAGHPIVVDSGVGAYMRSLEIRNSFRGASGKNVLLIDGQGPSQPGAWFSWERTSDAILCAGSGGGLQVGGTFRTCGEHGGFGARLGARVFVERSIEATERGEVRIRDRWEADRSVTPRLRLTLDPRLRVDLGGKTLRSESGLRFDFRCDSDGPDPKVSAERTPWSRDYGSIEDTTALCIDLPAARGGCLVTSFSRNGPIREEPGEDGG